MGRLLDEDDVVDWLLKRTEMYDATGHFVDESVVKKNIESQIAKIPSAQPEVVRCKDCKFYSPMNRETKTGICNLIMHQNFGDNWFCAGAERRTDD